MYMDDIYQIPERCKDCVFIKGGGDTKVGCMLGRTLTMASGCPNKETERQYISNSTFN